VAEEREAKVSSWEPYYDLVRKLEREAKDKNICGFVLTFAVNLSGLQRVHTDVKRIERP